MLLFRQIICQRIHDILIQDRALGDERINSFLVNLPGDSVDQQSILNGIVLTEHRVLFEFFGMQDIHISVDKKIQLGNGINIEMLMDKEQLHFMEQKRISQSIDENLHHVLVHISIVQVSHVYM
jgi:hypothetical protein